MSNCQEEDLIKEQETATTLNFYKANNCIFFEILKLGGR
jgi:hypothetical protein